MANIFDNHKIINQSLDEIMSESFGKYAKYIIQDRALPDIRDGLKPVQRRILHAMNELKIHFDKPYKKSARTVGEVIGKYHPHGDSSIYDAMVRMAQNWKNNIPLIDMQGNKGSIDGDSPAAMRYTECRLSRYGQLLLDDIEKDTVKFVFNFDDSEREPTVLPSLIPNILINGSTGIAAGYATNIPPFNINEVLDAIIYKIKHPNAKATDIIKIMKGPDFPTGGTIQGRDEILSIYETGRGKFNIRGKFVEVEKSSLKKHKQLIITELPYEVNKANLVKAIDEIRIAGKLPGLKEVRDDSDKSGISIMLDLETEKPLDVIKNYLYKNTQMQISYSANIIVIKDRKPSLLGISEILTAYLEHANQTIVNAAQFDLNKANARKEILEGLIKAISEIDELVSLVKSSDSKDAAKQKIIQHFDVNERQAEAIVQLRLYVLTSYDSKKLTDELVELNKFIDFKTSLIDDEKTRSDYLIDKLKEFKTVVGTERKTRVEDEIEDISIDVSDVIEKKEGILIVTRDNYLKFINMTEMKDVDLDKINIKTADIPAETLKISTLDTLICFTNRGKYINIPVHKIKMTRLKEKGMHINDLITIDSADKTVAAIAISKETDLNTEVVFATEHSLIKRIKLEELPTSKNTKVSGFISLKNNDQVVSAFVLKNDHSQVATVTQKGVALRYSSNEIPLVGKSAGGVKNILLKDGDLVASSFLINESEPFVMIASNRGIKRIYYEDIPAITRAKVGKKILTQVDSNPYEINSAFVINSRQHINVLGEDGTLHIFKAADIPISDSHARMSKYPNDIESVLKVNVVDVNRNKIDAVAEPKKDEVKNSNSKVVKELEPLSDDFNLHDELKNIDKALEDENENNLFDEEIESDHEELNSEAEQIVDEEVIESDQEDFEEDVEEQTEEESNKESEGESEEELEEESNEESEGESEKELEEESNEESEGESEEESDEESEGESDEESEEESDEETEEELEEESEEETEDELEGETDEELEEESEEETEDELEGETDEELEDESEEDSDEDADELSESIEYDLKSTYETTENEISRKMDESKIDELEKALNLLEEDIEDDEE